MTDPATGQPPAGGYPGYPGGTDPAGYGGGNPPVPSAAAGGFELAGPGIRFGAFVLNLVLSIVTLGIGYLVWLLIVWKDGKNPAWQILGLQARNDQTGAPLTWGQSFVRNFVFYGVLSIIPFYQLVGAVFTFNDDRKSFWDKLGHAVVVKSR